MTTKYSGLIILAICFLTAFSISQSYGQTSIETYTKQKSAEIKTTEPTDENYGDLGPVGDAIGDSRVVMLGEQGHGDGTTFSAKSRLVKYLHERKGFDVLAFEGDFFGLNAGWDGLKKDPVSIDDFVLKNVYMVWSLCESCSYLFYNYLPNTYKSDKNLIISGFDCHQYQPFSLKNLPKMLDSVLEHDDLPITKEANYSSEILPLINSSLTWVQQTPQKVKIEAINQGINYLDRIKQQLIAKEGGDNFWVLVADNMIEQANDAKEQLATGKITVNNRDAQMAKNLAWLINTKYKDRKIIVWAANSHIARSLTSVNDTIFKTARPMTEDLIPLLSNKEKIYILGFTSFAGTTHRFGRDARDFKQADNNNFESWMNEKKYSFAFLDFSSFNAENINSNEKFPMAPLGHFSVDGLWNKIFDGIFYIQQMSPCVPLEHHP